VERQGKRERREEKERGMKEVKVRDVTGSKISNIDTL